MLIGNGVMLTERRWRRKARNTYYSRHYYYGPEIDSLLESCQYDESDDRNPSCLMGNKLADQVINQIFRPSQEWIHTIVSASATMWQMVTTKESSGTQLLTNKCTTSRKTNLLAVQMTMECKPILMILLSRNSSMLPNKSGMLVMTMWEITIKKTPIPCPCSIVLKRQDWGYSCSLEMSTLKFHMCRLRSISSVSDGEWWNLRWQCLMIWRVWRVGWQSMRVWPTTWWMELDIWCLKTNLQLRGGCSIHFFLTPSDYDYPIKNINKYSNHIFLSY